MPAIFYFGVQQLFLFSATLKLGVSHHRPTHFKTGVQSSPLFSGHSEPEPFRIDAM
jgi:hypothetical protein